MVPKGRKYSQASEGLEPGTIRMADPIAVSICVLVYLFLLQYILLSFYSLHSLPCPLPHDFSVSPHIEWKWLSPLCGDSVQGHQRQPLVFESKFLGERI